MDRTERWETAFMPRKTMIAFSEWLDKNVETFYEEIWSVKTKQGKLRVYELTEEEAEDICQYEMTLSY